MCYFGVPEVSDFVWWVKMTKEQMMRYWSIIFICWTIDGYPPWPLHLAWMKLESIKYSYNFGNKTSFGLLVGSSPLFPIFFYRYLIYYLNLKSLLYSFHFYLSSLHYLLLRKT